jgi:hypothetical protein
MKKETEKEYESNRKKLLFWLAFLRLSRSYTIARAYKLGKLSKDTAYKEVPDLDKVIFTVEKFGNVWQNPLEWFDENIYEIRSTFTGAATPEIVSILTPEKSEKKTEIANEVNSFLHRSWSANGHDTTMLVSIPLNVKKNYLFSYLKKELEQLERELNKQSEQPKPPKKYELTKEKVRMDALEKAYNLVMMKAANKEMPNWQLAEHLGLCANSVATVKKAASEKLLGTAIYDEAEIEAHKSINAVIWRYTRFAYVLAENAARGEFPKAMREDKAEKEKRLSEYKKKYVRLKPEFFISYLHKKTLYFQHRLKDRGMEHKYANEFLVAEANINKKRVPNNSKAEEHSTLVAEDHENFIKNRRTYKPLDEDDEDINRLQTTFSGFPFNSA